MGEIINSNTRFLERKQQCLEDIQRKIRNNKMRIKDLDSAIEEVRKTDLENQILLSNESQLEREIQEVLYKECPHILWQDRFNPSDVRCPECGFNSLSARQLISPLAYKEELDKISSSHLFSSDVYGSYRDFCIELKDLMSYYYDRTLEEIVEIFKNKKATADNDPKKTEESSKTKPILRLLEKIEHKI